MNKIILLITLLCLSTSGLITATISSSQQTHDELFAEAQERLAIGEHYYCGNGVAQDYPTARKYFEGVLKLEAHNPAAAARASCWIGEIEYLKNSGKSSLDIAIMHFETAAEQMLDFEAKTFALMRLGNMAMDGDGMPVNTLLAKRYFERAIQAGVQGDWTFAKATSELCLGILQFSLAETTNYGRARDAISKNIEHVALHSQLMGTLVLGKMFLQGAGGPKDPVLAAQCFKRVISLADELTKQANGCDSFYKLWQIEAQAELGLLYLHGEGVQKNMEQARTYLTTVRTSLLFAKLDPKVQQNVETACSRHWWRH